LELTTFKSPLVSRISRSSPKPLPRIYIRKAYLEHEEEESFTELCCQNSKVLFPSRSVVVRFPSLVEKLKEEQGERGKEECIYTLR
jgi:hypothetical protein